jgi:16S rRNA (cytosine967-C5)-methyltransferase
MQISKSARVWALDTLQKWQQENAFSNLLLNQQLQKSNLDNRDKRLVTELVYGTIQRLNTLDHIIDQLGKTKKMDLWVRQLLQLSLYQSLFLDKIPERAVVHEAVEIAKWKGNIGVSKFINGVLRSFLRRKDEFVTKPDATSLKDRALFYSFPEWMVAHLTQAYGIDIANKVMDACNLSPKISIRINALRSNRDEYVAKWEERDSIEVAPSIISDDGIILEGGGNAADQAEYREGLYTVQDESSMLVAAILDPKPGMHILDACAAPGGKTTHLAEKMQNKGRITALDIHKHKVKLIESSAKRLGISIIETKAMDVRKFATEELFDAVLLDAPCSGLGVIPRKPDIKWRKSPEEIDQLVLIQQQLLETVAPKIKSGGILVYSTCTWTKAENEQQIARFLANHPDYYADDSFQHVLPEKVKETAILGDGWIQILPHHFHSDGFFIARLRRK